MTAWGEREGQSSQMWNDIETDRDVKDIENVAGTSARRIVLAEGRPALGPSNLSQAPPVVAQRWNITADEVNGVSTANEARLIGRASDGTRRV